MAIEEVWLYGRIIKSFDASVTLTHHFFGAIKFQRASKKKELQQKRTRLHRLVRLHYRKEHRELVKKGKKDC